jgi:hypothetical protein
VSKREGGGRERERERVGVVDAEERVSKGTDFTSTQERNIITERVDAPITFDAVCSKVLPVLFELQKCDRRKLAYVLIIISLCLFILNDYFSEKFIRFLYEIFYPLFLQLTNFHN